MSRRARTVPEPDGDRPDTYGSGRREPSRRTLCAAPHGTPEDRATGRRRSINPDDRPDRGAGAPAPGGARGAVGRYGEELAARRLTEAGLTILARNWRAGRTGEIDIVARDGDTLVICEVKTRRAGTFEHPMAAVTPVKAERLRTLAQCWLHEHGAAPPGGVRIDVVGVVVPHRGAPEVQHVPGVA